MTKLQTHFRYRHIGPDKPETEQMLQAIGVDSLDQLINQTVPEPIRLGQELELKPAISEHELLELLRNMGRKNQHYRTYIGMGYYGTHLPPAIQRNVLENPGWYTAYTPYQAEISQGRLEALLNYQTMVSDLTGLPLANSSLLDEATAAAEAMSMFYGLKKKKQGEKFFVSDRVFPQTLAVLQTRAEAVGIELEVGDIEQLEFSTDYFGVLMQYPDGHGRIRSYKELCEQAHEHNVLVAVATDLMSLVMLTPPGEWGADVALGNSQRFGVPMGYGGPHAAFFATRDEYKRQVPGRIIGVSIDAHGNRALRMALQTREQHIRREKATSNICTAQVLLANIASFYAVYHGPVGLQRIASRIHASAKALEHGLQELGYEQLNDHYFDTLKVKVSDAEVEKVRHETLNRQINIRYVGDGTIGISVDETTQADDLKDLLKAFAAAKGKPAEDFEVNIEDGTDLGPFARQSEFMQHPVFNAHHSETELMRYIKGLENKDLSLTHSMIPLGSCTMKLNATAELMPITWPEWNQLHPFVPENQALGYRQLIQEFEEQLAEITGFHRISLQPNSGAQGEYAGLLVIRAYLKDKGEGHRNIALIPSSAHGTNPASAVMAGMEVVVVRCDENGNIDVDDLKAKAEEHRDNLACLMVTYPSTHGVFEVGIRNICGIIHENGGQVYMDGANMNAQVGLTNPALIEADVCHLNLHKTFCIPHGGGGPGMGPIGVAEHLAPYLPGHPVVKTGGEKAISAVSAAPWGSATILLISYAYIRMMGIRGMTEATRYAILNANYIAARLKGHYDVLYTGQTGRVAHELILDMRPFKHDWGIEVEDIAKRLIDYGFHAPTMSFPVPGTMMIEPTESENKEELDRFCEALIQIRKEMAAVGNGEADAEDNVLKNAPHTAEAVISDSWSHPYSREEAAYPLKWVRNRKFWVSIGRVNNPYGDRNLMCTCPPIEEYEKETAPEAAAAPAE